MQISDAADALSRARKQSRLMLAKVGMGFLLPCLCDTQSILTMDIGCSRSFLPDTCPFYLTAMAVIGISGRRDEASSRCKRGGCCIVVGCTHAAFHNVNVALYHFEAA